MNEVLEPAEKVRFQMLHSLRRIQACNLASCAPNVKCLSVSAALISNLSDSFHTTGMSSRLVNITDS